MNFKTTIILLIVLAAAGVGIYLTRDHTTPEPQTAATAVDQKLFTFNSGDVQKLTITPAEGEPLVLQRDGLNWKMTSPQDVPADTSLVTDLVDTMAGLQSRGEAEASGADAQAAGLDTPRYKIQIETTDGKTSTLAVGDRSGTGNLLYVRKDGAAKANLVDSDIFTQLDKPARDFRRMKLLDVNSTDVNHLEIVQPDSTVVLEKQGTEWKITQPTPMPAEQSKVTDLVLALTTLTADSFVNDPSSDLRRYGLDHPSLTVRYGVAAPATTQPGAATQPAGGEVKFGFLGLMKKNVYAQTSASPDVVQVPASSMDSFKKKALDLRDLKVVDVAPGKVDSIIIESHLPATTQPTTRPAEDRVVTLVRRPPPATSPTTTGPASRPAPQSQWTLDGKKPANDGQVNALLESLHPLRATSYLDLPPTPVSAAEDHYVITLNQAAPMVGMDRLTISDPGGGRPLVGRYNDLTFELDRSLLDKLKVDFTPSAANESTARPPEPAALPTGPAGP